MVTVVFLLQGQSVITVGPATTVGVPLTVTVSPPVHVIEDEKITSET